MKNPYCSYFLILLWSLQLIICSESQTLISNSHPDADICCLLVRRENQKKRMILLLRVFLLLQKQKHSSCVLVGVTANVI